MIKKLNEKMTPCGVEIANADPLQLFKGGLEYSAPARGTWNIVHTGMLIPDAHEIFVCAAGCLRGVVLTAAEMNAANRFSTIEIKENSVLDGGMETLITNGVTDILQRLLYTPRAVLLYTSCIHHFMGCDMDYVFDFLRKKFPQIDFTDCYMNPIMRKSGLTPDQLMRRGLYSLLKPMKKNEKLVAVLGNDFATDKTSDLTRLILSAGYTLAEITDCKTYDEYLKTAAASLNITYAPAAKCAGDALQKRLGTPHLYLPSSFCFDTVSRQLDILADTLKTKRIDHAARQKLCADALSAALEIIQNTPIAIDYTAVSRPFELALLLTQHGFNVKTVYADSVSNEEKQAFFELKTLSSALMLYPTTDVSMRFSKRKYEGKILCIGQKAAYFTGSKNFVNIVEGGGHYGYDGIIRLCAEMTDAFLVEKDAKNLIQIKGLGCECCL